MRRIILILCLLCAHWAARGQAKYDYRYWFDGDETTLRTGTSTTPAWRMDVGLEGLGQTFHTLHFQVKDTAWSAPVTRYFMKLPEQGAQTFTYWFDNKGEEPQSLTATDGTAMLDVSGMTDGFHFLHMAYGQGAQTGLPRSAIFWKLPIEGQLQYRLWADNDHGLLQSGRYTGAPLMVDVSQMEDGFHFLHAQVDGKGSSSIPYTKMFIKVPQTAGVDYLTCLFMVDNEVYKQEKVPSSGGIVHWEFDASAIPQGLHKAQGLIVTPSGVASNVQEGFFFRTMTTTEKASMQCYYSIDGETHQTQAGRLDGKLFHFDLDVAGLSDGFHRLSYMLMGNNGTSSRVLTAFFFKTPLGGNGITQYNYWLNDKEAQMHVTKLDERTDPLKLITLLPVEACPIRSSCFQFEVEDGQPMLYARNDLHMRFYDVSGRITEATEQFVDYNVGRKVTGVEPLEGAEGQARHKKPEKDGILWYSIEAAIGDSLAIRSNQACTVQIFAPDGEEVYAASGAESVSYGGCHAYKDGTYYVALHDVTATGSGDITLDYQHIDKYAVLRYGPCKVGVSTKPFALNLFGNGMDKLVKAEIKKQGKTVAETTEFEVGSISSANAIFTFEDKPYEYGKHDIVLTFADEKGTELLAAAEAFELEAAMEGSVEVKIINKPTMALPYPVTVRVSNTGNVRHTNVPLFFGYDNLEGIEALTFGDFEVVLANGTRVTDMKDIAKKYEIPNANMMQAFISVLEPYTTIDLKMLLTAQGHTRTNLYAFAGPDTDVEPETGRLALAMPLSNEAPPGYYWESYPKAGKGCMILRKGTGLKVGLIGTGSYYDSSTETLGSIAFVSGETAGSIASGGGTVVASLIADNGEPTAESTSAYAQTMPLRSNEPMKEGTIWCPKDPVPYPIEITTPGDPNDIFGYRSESDTTFIRKGLTDVFYNIEFENDPKIATAAAHTIVIKDTLDPRYFDLSSFRPTSIKLGEVMTDLDGEPSFVKTVDLRPTINVIAEVRSDYDEKKGISIWTIASLDPMTMEPTDNPMWGVLPINHDGNGQGEIAFDIKLKADLPDGVEISNRAAIVFDNEAPIITPTWTNVVDIIAPTSTIAACEARNDSTVVLHFEASDNRSGVWKYDLYAQEGTEAPWIKVAEDVESDQYEFKGFSDINYGFCVVATDSAGNVEPKVLEREISKPTFKAGDANGDCIVDVLDATLATDKYLGKDVHLNFVATDANKDGMIDAMDVSLIRQIYLSTSARARTILEPRTRIKIIKRQ